jgi:hypothetical protein
MLNERKPYANAPKCPRRLSPSKSPSLSPLSATPSTKPSIEKYLRRLRQISATAPLKAYRNTLNKFRHVCHKPAADDIDRDDVLALKVWRKAHDYTERQRSVYNNFLNLMIFLRWWQTPLKVGSSAWLLLNPESVSIAPISATPDPPQELQSTLLLRARPTMVIGAEPLASSTLLPSLEQLPEIDSGFHVTADSYLELTEANTLLNDPANGVAGHSFPRAGNLDPVWTPSGGFEVKPVSTVDGLTYRYSQRSTALRVRAISESAPFYQCSCFGSDPRKNG